MSLFSQADTSQARTQRRGLSSTSFPRHKEACHVPRAVAHIRQWSRKERVSHQHYVLRGRKAPAQSQLGATRHCHLRPQRPSTHGPSGLILVFPSSRRVTRRTLHGAPLQAGMTRCPARTGVQPRPGLVVRRRAMWACISYKDVWMPGGRAVTTPHENVRAHSLAFFFPSVLWSPIDFLKSSLSSSLP